MVACKAMEHQTLINVQLKNVPNKYTVYYYSVMFAKNYTASCFKKLLLLTFFNLKIYKCKP